MKPSQRGVWLVALAAFSWGTVGIAVQFLYQITDTNALSVGFYRLALAVPALGLALFSTLGRRAFTIRRADLGAIALMGAMLALYQLCYFVAIARIGVTVATLVTLCAAPVLVALSSTVLLPERVSKRVWISLALAVIGTLLLTDTQPAVLVVRGQRVFGLTLALGSALGYALVILTGRHLAAHYHPLQPTALAFTIGAVILLPFSLSAGLSVQFSPTAWALLVYLGLVPTALGYVLFVIGMRTTQATAASIITLLEPLTATLLAWLLLGEKLGIWGVVGGALLLTAIVRLSVKPKDS